MPRAEGLSMPVAKRSSKKSTRKFTAGFRRLPLASLRVFVAAAEHLSFSQAADALGVSAAAVSMQIRALEEYLGSPLFHRRGRLVQLTAAGVQLLPRVRNGLAELERAINEARLEQRTGPLTVSMLASFLQQWLLLRLPGFNERHPKIDMRIHTSDQLVDFGHSDVQAAIRFGNGSWPKLHCEKLLDEWVLAVCTRQLLEKHGPVSRRADLRRYRLLHEDSEAWRAWPGESTDEGTFMAEERRGATFDDSVSVVRAAGAGQGLALVRWSLVAQDIECGRLAIASRTIIPIKLAYYFVCPASYLSMEKIAAFRAWIMEEARRAPRPPLRS
jgi:LysR family transcriptional regulator, glycine cleavage system transcriptional activator